MIRYRNSAAANWIYIHISLQTDLHPPVGEGGISLPLPPTDANASHSVQHKREREVCKSRAEMDRFGLRQTPLICVIVYSRKSENDTKALRFTPNCRVF